MQFAEFIDIHTHVLPGLDDGAKDMEASLALCRCYEKVGVKRIIATPHFLPGTAWAAPKEKVLDVVRSLQMQLDKKKIDLKIESGMEIAFHKKMEERILSGELLPLAGRKFYLIEPAFNGDPDSLLESLNSLLSQETKLILAHPERIEAFQQRPELLDKPVALGLLVQVNAGSLLGYFGKKSQKTAEQLWHKKQLHLVASDTHDTKKRAPLNRDEWATLTSCSFGKDMLSACGRNISEILG